MKTTNTGVGGSPYHAEQSDIPVDVYPNGRVSMTTMRRRNVQPGGDDMTEMADVLRRLDDVTRRLEALEELSRAPGQRPKRVSQKRAAPVTDEEITANKTGTFWISTATGGGPNPQEVRIVKSETLFASGQILYTFEKLSDSRGRKPSPRPAFDFYRTPEDAADAPRPTVSAASVIKIG